MTFNEYHSCLPITRHPPCRRLWALRRCGGPAVFSAVEMGAARGGLVEAGDSNRNLPPRWAVLPSRAAPQPPSLEACPAPEFSLAGRLPAETIESML
jgi:hypothetical protein